MLIYGSKADRIYTGVRPRIDPQVSYQPGSHLFGLTVWALIGAGAPAQIWAGQRVAARSVYAQPLDAASSGRTASSSCLLSCVDQQPASMAHRACRRPRPCRRLPPLAGPRPCRWLPPLAAGCRPSPLSSPVFLADYGAMHGCSKKLPWS